MRKALLSLTAVSLVLGTSATAAIETQDYSFYVTSATGPLPNQSGTFTLLFDSAANTFALDAISFSIGETSFSTSNTDLIYPFGQNAIIIGGTLNGTNGVTSDTDDFDLLCLFDGNSLTGYGYLYTTVGFYNVGVANNVIVSKATGVPEPSTWAMMLLGLGVIGFIQRRQKRSSFIPAT